MNPSEIDFGATIRAFAPTQKVFSRFTLVRLLGRGGMGVVWLAHDEKLEREIALKFLPEAVALDPRAVDDLKRETRRSLELTHPHIVRIYDFFEDSAAAAISMECVEGGSLAKLAVEQPLRCFEATQILPWLRQLVDALEYAHTKAKIVHRDLKPGNLMVSDDGDLKITDFGISATVTDSVTRVSRLMSSGATPAYSSPQQVMGERPSAADDIYSLGATIFDLLTGKPPFHTGNLLAQVQSKQVDSMVQRRAELGVQGGEIPESWERTVAACLAKEPAQRPASARAVLEGLEGRPIVVAGAARVEERSGKPATVPVPIPVVAEQKPAPAQASSPGPSKPASAGGFGVAWAMLRGARNLADVGRWLVAVLVGRAGLLPQLVAVVLPLALCIWLLTSFLGRGKDVAFNQPSASYSANPTSPAGPGGAQSLPNNDNTFGGSTPSTSNDGSSPQVALRTPTPSTSGGSSTASGGSVQIPNTSAGGAQTSSGAGATQSGGSGSATMPIVAPPPMPVMGSVEIVSDPSGATVMAEGRPIGRTPLALPDVRPGNVEFAVRLSGYEESIVRGTVKASETTRLTARLSEIKKASTSSSVILVPDIGIRLRWLQPGEFMLGSPESESGPYSDEQPQTRVRLTEGFWIGETEVTQGQWRALMGSSPGGRSSGGNDAPVVNISWDDAARYCQRLNDRERSAGRVPDGYAYQLPTEVQWEYACRAGTTGPYGSPLAQSAIVGQSNSSRPRNVASKQPNAWGLYDMHGNVSEWTRSWYGTYPGGAVDDFAGPPTGKVRVFRGGSYESSTRAARSAYRSYVSGSTGADDRGFRVVLAPSR